MSVKGPQRLIDDDPYLSPFKGALQGRYEYFLKRLQEIEEKEGGLEKFSRGYETFGIHETKDGITYKEWAPSASEVALYGDFCNWDLSKRVIAKKNEFGTWEVSIPRKADGSLPIPHNTKVKSHVKFSDGGEGDRVPAWIFCTSQDGTNPLDGRFWSMDSVIADRKQQQIATATSSHGVPPPAASASSSPSFYHFQYPRPSRPVDLRIYESHVGMSSEEGKINSYREYADHVLPYIKETGYNAVELMAIMEHAYYASFGYQVTNFFSIANRSGLPSDLMYLIDTAHKLGIVVIIDIVHSHASSNVLDGLNEWDGSHHQYFHDNSNKGNNRGDHPMWGSRLFNYQHWEVLRFLLSNIRYWLEVYNIDGFRFDGVTSMLYTHHGVAHAFGGYDDYYGGGAVDGDCLVYLTLANNLIHTIYPEAITIAEDVSGIPGMCRPVDDGGIGFDFRLGMAIPDMWIKMLKEQRDEDWNMAALCHTLTNRRYKENVVAYCESHDQALVGDKTIAFWLMDKEMYDWMSVKTPETPIIDRGIALHKMIRLITLAMGGEAYLTFMGNEFGHPEWIDFPRKGNNNSYHYCRRQWSLKDNKDLRYKFLLAFEKDMYRLEDQRKWLVGGNNGYVTRKDQGDKVIVFERSDLLFVFNFNGGKSFTDYRVGVMKPGTYRIVLDSDSAEYGGHCRLDHSVPHIADNFSLDGHFHSLMLYVPSRTAQVLAREAPAPSAGGAGAGAGVAEKK